MTIIIKTRDNLLTARQAKRAAEIVRHGGIVVFPTETVYGIGANALDAEACRRIYRIKGRARDNPLIVHVSSMRMAESVAVIPSEYYSKLKKLWPAPLTVIAKAKSSLPKAVTGGLNTVAIRMPDNEIALTLISESGVPLAAPSANISKKPSSTSASHARSYFNGKVDAIIDAGRSKFGVESTVIDLRSFRLLRPGAYTIPQIEKSLGRKPIITDESRGIVTAKSKPLSPGMKYRHYSPDKHLFLFTGDAKRLPGIIKRTRHAKRFTFIGSTESCMVMKGTADSTASLGSSRNSGEIASNLFGALISLDSERADFGVIEEFNEKGLGLAVMNRIRKACANRYFSDTDGLDKLIGEIS